MAEYIEREKAQDGLDNIDWYHVNDKGQLLPGGKSDIETYVPFKAVEEMLASIPAADVRPVVRAHWKPGDIRNVTAVCSNCGRLRLGNGAEWATKLAYFCEKCGADMRPEPPKEGET